MNDDMPRVRVSRVQELETFAVVSRERERLQIKRIQKACLGGREGAAGGAGMGHVRGDSPPLVMTHELAALGLRMESQSQSAWHS